MKPYFFLLISLIASSCTSLPVGSVRKPASGVGYLSEVQQIDLSADFTALFKGLSKVPGVLKVESPIKPMAIPVEIFVRGSSSREDCEFPKLRIEIKGETKGTPFEGMSTLALNTHCSRASKTGFTKMGRVAGDRGPLREGVVYLLQETLNIPGFGSRIVQVNYHDEAGKKWGEHFALALESKSHFAERNGARLYEEDEDIPNIEDVMDHLKSRSDLSNLIQTLLFEVMIGNSDYSLAIPDLAGERHSDRSTGLKGLWNLLLLEMRNGRFALGASDYDMSLIVRQSKSGMVSKYDSMISGCATDVCLIQFMQIQKWRSHFSRNEFQKAIDALKEKRNSLSLLIKNDSRLTIAEKQYFLETMDSFYKQTDLAYQIPVLQASKTRVYFDSDLKSECGKTGRDSAEMAAPAGLPAMVLEKGKTAKKVYLVDTRDGTMTNPLDGSSCVDKPVWIPVKTDIGSDWPR